MESMLHAVHVYIFDVHYCCCVHWLKVRCSLVSRARRTFRRLRGEKYSLIIRLPRFGARYLQLFQRHVFGMLIYDVRDENGVIIVVERRKMLRCKACAVPVPKSQERRLLESSQSEQVRSTLEVSFTDHGCCEVGLARGTR